MSQPTEPLPDVAKQLAQLTESVNRLVQAQQQLQAAPIVADIGGAIPGGAAPRAAIDVSRLSPVQQIALGLRDAIPVGPAQTQEDHPSNGAD